jgi:tetratricopeptide (TPR) repeat protein
MNTVIAPLSREAKTWQSHELGIALAFLTAIVFAGGMRGAFVFDDIYITEQPRFEHLWPWGEVAEFGRPFGSWTFQLNYALGGFVPWGFHLLNIAVHVASVCLLFGFVRRTLLLPGIAASWQRRAAPLAFAIALLWGLHPLQTGSVTYISQRYESLMGMFYLLCLYAVLRASRSSRPLGWYLVCLASFALGIGTKEVIATLPVVLLLYDRAFLSGSWSAALRRRWLLYAACLPPLVALHYFTQWHASAEPTLSAGFAYRGITPWQYLCSQAGVILHYLRLSFWPATLVLDYGWPRARSPWQIYPAGGVILALVGLSLWATWKRPKLGFVGMAFFLILAPTSSFMPIADLAFEHRMYLPLAAVATLVVFAAAWLLDCAAQLRPERAAAYERVALAMLLVVAGLLAYRTHQRNQDYHDPIVIWSKVVAYNPRHSRGHRMLARAYEKRGDHVQALQRLEESLTLEPREPLGWNEFGDILYRQGEFASAAEKYERAIEIAPRSVRAHLNLARARMRLDDFRGAIAATRDALTHEPSDRLAAKQLAWLLATAPDDALRDGAAAVHLLESLPPADELDLQYLEALAAAQAEAGRFDLARATAARLVELARTLRGSRVGDYAAELAEYQANRPHRMSRNKAT